MTKTNGITTEGTITTYLSERSVRGYPYLAEARLVAYRTKDGRLAWRPRGLLSIPSSSGVPASWYRKGTARCAQAEKEFSGAPRPWDLVDPPRERP